MAVHSREAGGLESSVNVATSAMLFLEISIVAFLLGENYASCLETLARTFMVSGLFVGVDLLWKVIFISGCLADFFKEEDWLLDSAYYSEMKDAGFFDADWEYCDKQNRWLKQIQLLERRIRNG